MSEISPTLEAIKYSAGRLQLLDQRVLPHTFRYDDVNTHQDGWKAIHDMNVRGAPAIAVAGCLSVAVEAHAALNSEKPSDDVKAALQDPEGASSFLSKRLEHLKTARPTAVNMAEAADRLAELCSSKAKEVEGADGARVVLSLYIEEAEKMIQRDINDNMSIGAHGADLIEGEGIAILTHCNTGSLATAGYGTALGVIRALHGRGRLAHAYCTETRPYNQGSRLTAFELVYEKIPATLVTDSMAGFLMNQKTLHAVVVGADRVAANGDTANKIGTYALAVLASHHNIAFYVAAPTTTLDGELESGEKIPIEQRPKAEFTDSAKAPHDIAVWNPAFDVTPHHLITGIITEFGPVPRASPAGVDGKLAPYDVAKFVRDVGEKSLHSSVL